MAAPLRPASNATFGKKNWIFVPTLSSQAAPTVAELTGASSLDFTNIAFASTGKPDQSTNRVTAERRLGDTIVYEQIGTTNYTGGDMIYQFDPTAAALSSGRKGWEKFGAGVSGFLVERMGISAATTPVATNKVNVYPVTFGPSIPTEAGDGETAETAAKCTYAITNAPSFDVAVV
jgi:hypothetical protein